MKIAIVSDARFVEELNRELRRHADFMVGMQFTPFPDDAEVGALSGFSVAGGMPADLIDTIVAATAASYGVRIKLPVAESALQA